MDLIDDPAPGRNAPEFTVSEISGAVKRMIEGEFGHVRIRGEVGRVSRPRSGHIYLDLKDDRAVIAAVVWKGTASRLPTQPEEGLEVVATGRLTTYPGQSKYQLIIEDIAPAGVGALMAMLEKRKKALEAEGLFAAERKRPLPFLPEVIGVVTSPSGAVIRDILHRLRDRFPRRVLIWPVAVQGERCAPEVTRAIEGFNALTPGGALPRPDLLIVARGGGSLEDLWGFNEESVARAAAASEIPLISAVGHETDTTLIDFVSDYRAPTPTAAAERAVPVRMELLGWLEDQAARLRRGTGQAVDRRRTRLTDLSRALPRPEALLSTARQRLDAADERLPAALRAATQRKRVALFDRGTIRPGLMTAMLRVKLREVRALGARLAPGLARGTTLNRRRFDTTASRLRPTSIVRELTRGRERLDGLAGRLETAQRDALAVRADRLASVDRLRETLGYKNTLARGYAVVWNGSSVAASGAGLQAGTPLEIEFADDERLGVVVGGGGTPRKKSKPAPKPPEQGQLL